MATSDLEKLPREWARAWSSSNDSESLLGLFTDDCVFQDVTFGVVTRGKEELRDFVNRAFAAVPDFKYELRSWFWGGSKGSYRVGYVGHAERRLPWHARDWQALFVDPWLEHSRTERREDKP
ncbi:MAG: nuclear transport factor 2 family protein [Candidatus Acidiferrales bacterium]